MTTIVPFCRQLFISMYHYTRDLTHSRYPQIKGLARSLFEMQLKFFKNNFNVVRMEDVIKAVQNDVELPENALLLTFDDGHIDNFTVAFPLLKKYGIQGSFFIPGKTFTENILLDVNKIHFILASAKIDELVKEVKSMLVENREEYNLPSIDELWDKYAVTNR